VSERGALGAVASPSAGPAAAGGRVALVVEDELLVGLYLERLLERHGWRVLGPAATVAEALRLLEQEAAPPAVALLDVTLGGESVATVAEALRARGVPLVLASGCERVEHLVPALAGAPNAGKPLDERHLLAVLAQAAVS
jgi:DNA-binding response OmpR family regulator